MLKNVIVIMDSVSSFINGFRRYIEKETEDALIYVQSFEDLKHLTFDYLLVEESMVEKCPYKDKRLFTITSQSNVSDKHICRFDRPNIIYHQMIENYEKSHNELSIISLYSMAGGTGKTSFAESICSGLESFGIVPFSLSFSVDMDKTSSVDLSLLIYYFAQNIGVPESVIKSIEEKVKSAQSTISCCLNRPEDSLYLTPDVVRQLITWLCECFDISYMVIEVPWRFGPCLEEVLRLSHKKLLIGDQRHSEELLLEWQTLYRQVISSDKGDYAVLNRSKNQSTEDTQVLYMDNFEIYTLKKGMKEWCSKYLLTHWMR
jgi:hypothetical protein